MLFMGHKDWVMSAGIQLGIRRQEVVDVVSDGETDVLGTRLWDLLTEALAKPILEVLDLSDERYSGVRASRSEGRDWDAYQQLLKIKPTGPADNFFTYREPTHRASDYTSTTLHGTLVGLVGQLAAARSEGLKVGRSRGAPKILNSVVRRHVLRSGVSIHAGSKATFNA